MPNFGPILGNSILIGVLGVVGQKFWGLLKVINFLPKMAFLAFASVLFWRFVARDGILGLERAQILDFLG